MEKGTETWEWGTNAKERGGAVQAGVCGGGRLRRPRLQASLSQTLLGTR